MKHRFLLAACLLATLGYSGAATPKHRRISGGWEIKGTLARGFDGKYHFYDNGTFYLRPDLDPPNHFWDPKHPSPLIKWRTGTYRLENNRLMLRFRWLKDDRGKVEKLHEKCQFKLTWISEERLRLSRHGSSRVYDYITVVW